MPSRWGMNLDVLPIRIRRSAVVALVSSLGASGCSYTLTSTSTRETAAPPTKHIRLTRPDASPLAASWKQDGHRLHGELAFTEVCQTETVHVTHRERVEETRPNPTYTTTGYVVGSAFLATGIGFLLASANEDETVHCGVNGEVRHGTRCGSLAGSFRDLGLAGLAIGGGLLIGSVLHARSTPTVTTTALPAERRVVVAPTVHACGDPSELEGIVVSAELSDGGTWSGTVDARGSVAIELSSSLTLHGDHSARFTVTSVPEHAPKLVKAGT
ncbi:MAG TPA: hypothetical protein VKY73_08895, partial [Polyangiaceae bacterium]|nr:hypothetical protein [Polyangiaceae bacterium]